MRTTIRKSFQRLVGVSAVALLLGVSSPAWADPPKSRNIIQEVISAPVVTNGLTANQPTEFNILLAGKHPDRDPADPENFGHQIPAGGRMEVELGGAYVRNIVGGNPVPINANANIILTIAPQNPITSNPGGGVHQGNWSVTDDGDRLITITPNGGAGKNGLEGARAKEIGIKVIHVRPGPTNPTGAPFQNGSPGEVGTIGVRIYDQNGKLKESGRGHVMFQASDGRQVHLTNAGLAANPSIELVESTHYQRVAPNTSLTNTSTMGMPFSVNAPYAPRFLLFESLAVAGVSFIPQPGINNVSYVVNAAEPWRATIFEGASVIGAIVMDGPSADSRGVLLANPAVVNSGGNGTVLNVPVQVGSRAGEYRVTVELVGGNKATNVIVAK